MRSSLLFLLALSCSACGTTLNYIATREPPRTMSFRQPALVDVYMTGRPNRPFVEVGMIESQQESMSLDDEQAVVEKMRRFAGERGCDALAIFAGNDATQTSGSTFTTSHTLKGYRGACLVYTDSAALPAAPGFAANSCVPNATQLCYGPGGCRGGQRCTADGKGYTLCDCGGAANTQHSAAGPTGAASGSAR